MSWRGAATAALERGLHPVLRLLPARAGSALGLALGRHLLPGLYPVASERARAALARLRPDLDAEAALREAWANIAATFTEIPRGVDLWAEGRVAVAGAAHVLGPRRAGRPVVVAGLHTGNPELIGLALVGLGLRPAGIAMRQPGAFRQRVVHGVRTRTGARVILAGPGAMREALAALRAPAEGVLILYVDEVAEGVVRGPSLGRSGFPRARSNLALAARLARRAGAALVPGYVTRRPGAGARFLVTFLPPLGLPGAPDRLGDAGVLDAALDPVVRALLPQWLHLIAWRETAPGPLDSGPARPADDPSGPVG